MLRIIKIVTSKTYVQKALILNGFFLLAQPPGERKRTIAIGQLDVELTVTRTSWHHGILMVIGKGVNFCARECLLFACT